MVSYTYLKQGLVPQRYYKICRFISQLDLEAHNSIYKLKQMYLETCGSTAVTRISGARSDLGAGLARTLRFISQLDLDGGTDWVYRIHKGSTKKGHLIHILAGAGLIVGGPNLKNTAKNVDMWIRCTRFFLEPVRNPDCRKKGYPPEKAAGFLNFENRPLECRDVGRFLSRSYLETCKRGQVSVTRLFRNLQ